MSDDLYRLIPEEGKHLAESRDTEGAYRGVYLDDETNKPSGAGEFVKVDPDELYDRDGDIQLSDSTSETSDAGATIFIVAAAFAIGVGVAKTAPHVKKWVNEKAAPAIKRVFRKKDKSKGAELQYTPESTEISEEIFVEHADSIIAVSVEVAYDEYRENMSSEEAQRELIEAFVLYLESMKKVKRVEKANVIDSDGRLTSGKVFLDTIVNSGMLESVNNILRNHPALLEPGHEKRLSAILGYEISAENEFIPITVDALTGSFAEMETNYSKRQK